MKSRKSTPDVACGFNVLPREFYSREPVSVARDLLGKLLVHGDTSGRIVEVEAYLGKEDRAAHSARGLTGRTRVIFGPPGHAYVYFIYGMYECLNIVTEPEGVAGCVLIRALEPVDGIEVMQERRPGVKRIHELANGPGKLTLAMGIDRRQYGADLTHGLLTVRDDPRAGDFEIRTTPRVGIRESADLPLRFYMHGNAAVPGQSTRPIAKTK
jgi:DNA-3-methyladenine glycosylase